MAIIILGKSKCAVCGKLLLEGDDVVGTRPFLKATHPLGRFSDAGFHRACYASFPERQAFEEAYEEVKQLFADAPRT
jgi:hypothetical protein